MRHEWRGFNPLSESKRCQHTCNRNSNSPVGKELKQFNDTFIKLKVTKVQFIKQTETYLKTDQDYLNEMSETDPKQPKHKRLRKALNKYKNNHKYMFTYKINPDLKTPNTTNKVDGSVFSHLKRVVNLHSGTTKLRRKNLIIEFLNSR
jgi:hypothetical protein